MMDLRETMAMMRSSDFKDRTKAEYWQLKIRCEKLEAMCNKYAAGELDFTPNCSLELLQKQLGYMNNYLDILEMRAEIENIDLEDVYTSTEKEAPIELPEEAEEKDFSRVIAWNKGEEYGLDIPAGMDAAKAMEIMFLAMCKTSIEEDHQLGLPEGSLLVLRFQNVLKNLK